MKALVTILAVSALVALSPAAHATTVAPISGAYDDLGFDTPDLAFNVPTGLTIQNAQMVLHGYQNGTLNHGISQTVSLGTLGTGTTPYIWSGSFTPGNLTAKDYDDEYVGTSHILPSGPPCCAAGGAPAYFALVGNFDVTFKGNVFGNGYTGQLVSSYFSPTFNYTGGFVGWEGLDPSGYSESTYDLHNGVATGTLAQIYL